MPVGSRVTASTPNTTVLNRINMPPNDLSSTKQTSTMALDDLNIMTHIAQLLGGFFRNTVFEVNSLVKDITAVGHSGADADARGVESGLWCHLEDEHVHEHLHVSLRLHETAHDSVD